MQCYCGSVKAFAHCCQPLIEHQQPAPTAESLMRSRFSAYACKNYDYILATYCEQERLSLDSQTLKQAATGSEWLALSIEATSSATEQTPEQVRFCAYYRDNGQLCQLRETSNFVLENGQWRYQDGEIHPDSGQIKWPRNQNCFCGSGRKYKRCHAD